MEKNHDNLCVMKILPSGIAVIEGDTHISHWVETEGRLDHDQYSLPIILPHIEEGDWVVDAGAFIGDHTIAYLNAVGDTGMVFAFEPNQKAFDCLIHNCPDAECLPFGLGDKDDFISFKESENAGASHLDKTTGAIPVVPLDSYNLGQLDFLKLDVEGYELKALQGAIHTIDAHRPKMWIEINRWALQRQGASSVELLNAVVAMGYAFTAFPPEGGPQYDILCIPSSSTE